MKISIAQINTKIGDLDANLAQIKDIVGSHHHNSDIIVFPELTLTGYPPKDLLFHQQFLNDIEQKIEELKHFSTQFPDTAILIGYPKRNNQERGLYNMAGVIQNGKCIFEQAKTLLPNYDVFEETRYFDMSKTQKIWTFKGIKIGLLICEDVWFNNAPTHYSQNPIEATLNAGAELIIAIMASPYEIGKPRRRRNLFKKHAGVYKVPIIYVNQIGANDDLIFDGHSAIISKKGNSVYESVGFDTEVTTHTFPCDDIALKIDDNDIQQLKNALVLGIRDYTQKTGFSKVLIGLSGGIDSAVVTALATEALGKDNVLTITMPSPYSSKGSVDDSKALAANLGIQLNTIPIEGLMSQFETTLIPNLKSPVKDITEQNLQARIRGTLLMAYSNQYGHLVLTTGNKSEMAVGYCTLYGDMNGGLGVIADLTKTQVYQLAALMSDIIPQNIITKAPSAELKPNQKDQDTLPPYDILDAILSLHIENFLEEEDIINLGYDTKTVKWVLKAVHQNEYKRRQAAPALKVSSRTFGTGRRMVISSSNRINP